MEWKWTAIPKGREQLRVYYKWPSGSEHTVPLIMLQGEWFRSSGFDIGDEVLVTIRDKQLIVNFEKKNGD